MAQTFRERLTLVAKNSIKAAKLTSERATNALPFPSQSSNWLQLLLPQTSIDYASKIGDPLSNSAVSACVNWIGRTFPQAPLTVEKAQADGTYEIVAQHKLAQLLRRPNPYYSGLLLWWATLTSWTLDGNAYWYKVRNAQKQVIQLLYLPHFAVCPKWDEKGTEYITHYEYRPAGSDVNKEPQKIDPKDIVHFRYGIDPENTRKGRAPLKAVLKEIFSDNEASTFAAALLSNMGIPGVVIAPKDTETEITKEQGQALKQKFLDSFSKDKRGEPLVISGGIDVKPLSFNPQQLDLKQLHRLPEERVCSVLGIPAIVVGLGAGLEAGTYSNFEQARQIAYEDNIIPTQMMFAVEIETQLLPDFESAPEQFQVCFDLTNVRVLQPDTDAIAIRMNTGVAGGWVTVSEAREAIGLPSEDSENAYLRDPAKVLIPREAIPAQVDLEADKEKQERQEKIAELSSLLQAGIITVDEAREELGLAPMPMQAAPIPGAPAPQGAAPNAQAQGTSGEASDQGGVAIVPGVDNVFDFEDGSVPDEEDPADYVEGEGAAKHADNILEFKATGAPKKTGPGSRGGKFWIDKNGHVRYDKPPQGTRARSPESWAKATRVEAKKQIKEAGGSPVDLEALQNAGWEDFGNDNGDNFDSREEALAQAQSQAQANPQSMFVVVRTEDGGYRVASKLISDLKNDVVNRDKSNADKNAADNASNTIDAGGKNPKGNEDKPSRGEQATNPKSSASASPKAAQDEAKKQIEETKGDLSKLDSSWESGVSGDVEIPGVGMGYADKNSAQADVDAAKTDHPDYHYEIVPVGDKFVIAAKPVADLQSDADKRAPEKAPEKKPKTPKKTSSKKSFDLSSEELDENYLHTEFDNLLIEIKGAAIDWTSDQLDQLAQASEKDIEEARELWREYAPHQFENLLDAKAISEEKAREDNELTPDFYWDTKLRRYKSAKTNRFVSARQVVNALGEVVGGAQDQITELSLKLGASQIELSEFQASMAHQLKLLHLASASAAAGGWAQMTDELKSGVQAELKSQYNYLSNLTKQIESFDVSLDGKLLNRLEMYGESGWVSYYETERKREIKAGSQNERRILGHATKNCNECVEAAARDWEPIGTLPKIGDTKCLTRCKCHWEFN